MTRKEMKLRSVQRGVWASRGIEAFGWAFALLITVTSAIAVKERRHAPAFVETEVREVAHSPNRAAVPTPREAASEAQRGGGDVEISLPLTEAERTATRWFDGRPIRPVRRIMMKVTAYSPDHRSCGIFADGMTATLHSVQTNGGKLVAADTRLLPFGSMLTIPGYANNEVVPVLDRGGAIKGHRLDLLYPTHAQARQWGVKMVPVTVWAYADGEPAPNPRRLR